AFLIPYMFVLQPQLLLIDTTIWEALWIGFAAILGMIAVGACMIGYWYRRLSWFERIISFVIGIAMIYPELISTLVGMGALLLIIAWQLVFKKVKGTTVKEAEM